MFGVLDLATEMHGCRFSIGVRNTHDKSMRLAMTVGYPCFFARTWRSAAISRLGHHQIRSNTLTVFLVDRGRTIAVFVGLNSICCTSNADDLTPPVPIRFPATTAYGLAVR